MFPGADSVPMERQNFNPLRQDKGYEIKETDRKRILELNRKDVEIYGRARERFHSLCSAFSVVER